MESKEKEYYEMEFGGKKYIFKLLPEKLICISDEESFFYKFKDLNYEEIKSLIMKKKIKNIKHNDNYELEIKYNKEDIYDEIKLYEKPNENKKEEPIESNGKKFI